MQAACNGTVSPQATDRNPLTRTVLTSLADAGTKEDPGMDDLKRDYREGEDKAKEAWRRSDGDEDLGDKLGNLGDDVRKELGNAGDDVRREADRTTYDRDPA